MSNFIGIRMLKKILVVGLLFMVRDAQAMWIFKSLGQKVGLVYMPEQRNYQLAKAVARCDQDAINEHLRKGASLDALVDAGQAAQEVFYDTMRQCANNELSLSGMHSVEVQNQRMALFVGKEMTPRQMMDRLNQYYSRVQMRYVLVSQQPQQPQRPQRGKTPSYQEANRSNHPPYADQPRTILASMKQQNGTQ